MKTSLVRKEDADLEPIPASLVPHFGHNAFELRKAERGADRCMALMGPPVTFGFGAGWLLTWSIAGVLELQGNLLWSFLLTLLGFGLAAFMFVFGFMTKEAWARLRLDRTRPERFLPTGSTVELAEREGRLLAGIRDWNGAAKLMREGRELLQQEDAPPELIESYGRTEAALAGKKRALLQEAERLRDRRAR